MTEQMVVRLPWVTLTGTPDRPGRWARVRCAAAMAVHEVVELVAGTQVAHAMPSAVRYAIGAPLPVNDPKDWPSKSELFGTFKTVSDRLDALDETVVAGGGLFTVSVVAGYPTQDIGWFPLTEEFPYANPQYANQYLLLMDQDEFPSGIWQFTADPVNEPPVPVIDPCDVGAHGYQYAGARITVASVLTGSYGDIVCAVDQFGGMFYRSAGVMQPLFAITAYTSNIDVTLPPYLSDGVTPLTDVTNGVPVPVLLTAQDDPDENGVRFATPLRATRSRSHDAGLGIPDPIITLFGDDGDLSGQGEWWAFNPFAGWQSY